MEQERVPSGDKKSRWKRESNHLSDCPILALESETVSSRLRACTGSRSLSFVAEQRKEQPHLLSVSVFVACLGEGAREQQNHNYLVSSCSISNSFPEGIARSLFV